MIGGICGGSSMPRVHSGKPDSTGSRILALLAAACTPLICPVQARAALTLFDPPDAVQTYAYSINGAGDVVGTYAVEYGDSVRWHGFIRKPGGTIKTIDISGALDTKLKYINDNGDIVGSYLNSSEMTIGFLRSAAGSVTRFQFRSDPTMPGCLNGGGLVAGNYVDPLQYWRAFIRRADGKLFNIRLRKEENVYTTGCNNRGTTAGDYENWLDSRVTHGYDRTAAGTVRTFDPPDSANTYVGGLNQHDSIAGYYEDSVNIGEVHGFLRTSNRTITSFDAPDAEQTYALAINDRNVIVGYYAGEYTDWSGFERSADGTVATFNINVASTIWPVSINDKGVIAGYYQDQLGELHGFLGTP
jgi:hypothetical protein